MKTSPNDYLCVLDGNARVLSRYAVSGTEATVQAITADLPGGVYLVYLQSNPTLKSRFIVAH